MPRCTELFTTAPADDGRTALAVRTWPRLLVPGVTLHPLVRGDTRTVQRVFDGLSPRSRQTRFLAVTPALAPAMAEQLADVDHDAHGCWVAHVSGAPVGMARYIRLADPSIAEIAVEVVDAYQGLGLGRLLVDVVGTAAADVGVTRLLWLMDETNRPVRRLASALGGRFVHDVGTVEATTELPTVPSAAAAEIARSAAAARRAVAARVAA
jgi:GNAT superfamily N-acetyltransferase